MKDLGWTISLDVDTAERADDDSVGTFLDELVEFGAVVRFGRDCYGYGAIFSLRRYDLDAPSALARGIRIFREAATRAGLPVGELVWAEIMTFAEHDRRLDSGRFSAPMDNGARDELLSHLAEAVGSVMTAHPTRVAFDGPPAAGKTTLADELAVILRAQGREVIRASIEGFLFPRSQRYRRGVYSGEACYHDSFDYDALRRVLLDPLGPGGDRRFQPAVYDKSTETARSQPFTTASADAVLLFEGVFLLRPELIDRWDLRIFVSTAFDETLDRARTRDEALYGSTGEVERRFRERYLPSQQLYFDAVQPIDHADIVVHNDEPQLPAWETRTP